MPKFKIRKVFPGGDTSKKPSKITIESPAYKSCFPIQRDAQGNICEPWVRLEVAVIKGSGKTAERRDFDGLNSHELRAWPEAEKEAKKLAVEEQQGKLL